MKIIIDRKGESQTPKVTIDLKTCHYPYAIRNAIELALELDGYDEITIKQVFNRQNDVKCEPEPSADLARS
jgi:hypothetical protein